MVDGGHDTHVCVQDGHDGEQVSHRIISLFGETSWYEQYLSALPGYGLELRNVFLDNTSFGWGSPCAPTGDYTNCERHPNLLDGTFSSSCFSLYIPLSAPTSGSVDANYQVATPVWIVAIMQTTCNQRQELAHRHPAHVQREDVNWNSTCLRKANPVLTTNIIKRGSVLYNE